MGLSGLNQPKILLANKKEIINRLLNYEKRIIEFFNNIDFITWHITCLNNLNY